VLEPILPHAVALIRGEKEDEVKKTHSEMVAGRRSEGK